MVCCAPFGHVMLPIGEIMQKCRKYFCLSSLVMMKGHLKAEIENSGIQFASEISKHLVSSPMNWINSSIQGCFKFKFITLLPMNPTPHTYAWS